MANLALIWKEICYRKLNFVLSCAGVAAAVTLFLAGAALLRLFPRHLFQMGLQDGRNPSD